MIFTDAYAIKLPRSSMQTPARFETPPAMGIAAVQVSASLCSCSMSRPGGPSVDDKPPPFRNQRSGKALRPISRRIINAD